ncbi:MAG: MogA/MoaB family molybdenum cofactor biosynthesis protein [Spirochaetales bacterium]|jgi:molybdopterin adenylyltransferase|nr:MogA/MoaB family molybdenum cofactor biosynthesis protein [Spirochaetales bacterium]
MKVCIVTVSDRAFRGEYADLSGPEIERLIREELPGWDISRKLVPDEAAELSKVFYQNLKADFILTTGGTGLSARDITPQTTVDFCDERLPGIEETLRSESLAETRSAMLSRGAAGIKGSTIIVNFPGSVRAAAFCTRILLPVMEHAVKMIQGGGH